MLKPKVGDLVRLKPLRVMGGDDSCGIRVSLATPEQQRESRWAYVQNELIEEILPRPLAVGDHVCFTRTGNLYEIIGLNADESWLMPINTPLSRVFSTVAKIEDLTRIDEL